MFFVDNFEQTKIAAEAATAVVTLLIAFSSLLAGKAWRDKYAVRKKRANRVADRICSVPEVFPCINEIALESGSDRALLIVAENGSPVFPTYVTIVSEVVLNPRLGSTAKDFQRVQIDRSYKMKIGPAVGTTNDFEVVRSEDLLDGMLKDHYDSEGIKQTVIVPIKRSHCDDWAVYLSLNMLKQRELTPSERTGIRLGSSKLREILAKFLPE